MNKREFIKNDYKMNIQLNNVEKIRYTLESNLNRIDIFNKENHLIDKELIYQLSTYKEEGSRDILINTLKKEFRLDSIELINGKFNYLIQLLFTPLMFKKEVIGDLYYMKNYLPLDLLHINITGKYESKECFNFDFKNNKVTIKESIKQQIEEENTIYIENKNQLKVLQIIENIDSEINELKKYYDNKGDIITNDIYFDINKLFTNTNIHVPKKLDLMNVYYYFLNKVS